MERVPHILHVFSTFVPGGQQVRTAVIISALGAAYRHTIMAMDGRFGAEKRIRNGARITLRPPPARKNVFSLAGAIREVAPDLLITYNWGAIEATAAGRFFSRCPVMHAEDGFGADEASGPKLRRALARRVVLNRIRMTVVPSRTLLRVALTKYCLATQKVKFIPNGVDIEQFQPRRDAVLRKTLAVAEDEVLFGFVGHLREEKNLALLLRGFAGANPAKGRLMLVGDGPCRAGLETLARELGIAEKMILAGHVEDTSRLYAALDVFVMSSDTEQMPLALLEAMACGLPAVCTDAGDTAAMLGETPVPLGSVADYAEALRRLAADAGSRAALGAKNRRRAVELYSLDRMVAEYAALYAGALRAG